jgi:conflict system STAND superfamily ATPase
VLIPEIRRDRAVIYVNEWGSSSPENIINDGIVRLRAMGPSTDERRYLILDPFEDIFKQDLNRTDVWEIFAEVANFGLENFSLLITMREEWLGAWEEVEQYVPSAFDSMVRLAPLTLNELRQAIIRPVQIEGSVKIDDAVVPRVLSDLRQPNAFGLGGRYIEPGLLQLVCQRLWDEAASSDKVITETLYRSLGGADRIIRDFVWRHLRTDTGESVFQSDQRVLWAGLTRHLSTAHGVKATVSAEMLSRKLLLSDLGIAGPAICVGKDRETRRYLEKPVEKREPAPAVLTSWISETLTVAAGFGFLKRQKGVGHGTDGNLFELARDALIDVFRAFSLDFEKWIARRVYILLAGMVGLLIVLPGSIFLLVTQGLEFLLLYLVAGGIYVGSLYIMGLLFRYLKELIYFPIVRALARGEVRQVTDVKPLQK